MGSSSFCAHTGTLAGLILYCLGTATTTCTCIYMYMYKIHVLHACVLVFIIEHSFLLCVPLGAGQGNPGQLNDDQKKQKLE